jgi:hypothetical protein
MLQLWLVANTILWELSTKVAGLSLGLSVVVLLFAGAGWLGTRLRITVSSAKVLLAFLVYSIFSLVVALAGPCTDHLQKSMLTTPILLFLILVGLEVGRTSSSADWLNLQKTATWSLVIAFSALVVEVLIPEWFPNQQRYRAEGKLSGLFSEPSHLAFALFPCIAVLLVAEQKTTRQRGMCALLGLLVLSRSSTLIAFIAAFVIYRLLIHGKFRQTAIFTLGVAVVVILGALIDYNRFIVPTIARVAGIMMPTETENISSLVYVQGWQDAWFNFRRTYGLGLGLNMMGCSPLPDVPARFGLTLIGLGGLNAEDGSFLFSKIVSETGIFGIILYVVAIWRWVQLERELHSLRKEFACPAAETQATLIFCFVTSSFIRGTGYFAGALLLWIAALAGASEWLRTYATPSADARLDTSGMRQIVIESSLLEESSGSSTIHDGDE